MKTFKKIIIVLFALLLLAGCSGGQTPSGGEEGPVTVKVGVCGANNDQWYAVQKVLDDEGANIRIELVEFDAYNLPNEALNAGDIDLNAFQHKAFLNNEVNSQGYKIETIGDTLIAPLTLYSRKYASLDELKNAAVEAGWDNPLRIAVPDDATNLARALKLLETAGLIEVDPAAGYTPEIKDITDLRYAVEVVPQKADTLPQTLDDSAAATINGTYAIPAGFVPSRDGLIIEDQGEGGDNPFVNIICARTADKDNEVYRKIVQAYQTQYVAAFILSRYENAYFPVFPYDAADAAAKGADIVKEVNDYKASMGY